MRTHKHSLHTQASAKAPHQRFRLERWHRLSLYAVVTALFASGLLWLLARYGLRQAGEFGETVHPLEHVSMQIHGGLALLTCFYLGSLLLQHLRRAHNAGRNRASGWSMLGLSGWLSLSGYGLYYLASESSHATWSLAHWSAGLGLPALLMLHIWLGRKAIAAR